jgi:uncharacterized membrane protein
MGERAPIFEMLALAVLALLFDLPWLTVSSAWAGEMIRDIQGSALSLKVVPAIIVYLALGYLATVPSTAAEAFGLGFATYAVYDFTNLATLKKYQPAFALADSTWGGVLFTILFYARERLFSS